MIKTDFDYAQPPGYDYTQPPGYDYAQPPGYDYAQLSDILSEEIN
ncbi:MAG: hypothetical protein AAFP03_01375 [Cyanobacteria bacterium J06598_3]